MTHYAFLDSNNIVTEIIGGPDKTELIEGLDPEIWYSNFRSQVCKRINYTGNTACGVGYSYNSEADVFVAPQPFASWSLDSNFDWQPPVAYPIDDKFYTWSEDDLNWKEVVND